MFHDNSAVRVPRGSNVVVQTPQRTWTGPGVIAAVVVLVALGALRGTDDGGRPATPREVVIAEFGTTALRAGPSADAPAVRDLGHGQAVKVICHTEGSESLGWGGTSRTWDLVEADGARGYVPDVAVNTRVSVDKIAPSCGETPQR
ncbi:hypothetical protein LO772_17290 [Yinghuangia sp. ASG 101]|uniref:hypothetical protein n=1 Tax=Yinghuangia sp. ASG 101 TaxID=2896848 RepID=UPI001E5AB7E2|nr:hypothetical protein [Yinghuangia sp. ASG 101]UGQ15165.1 hypothetical protein LO772_17290 [Yinghuangia sp. ASG 101]